MDTGRVEAILPTLFCALNEERCPAGLRMAMVLPFLLASFLLSYIVLRSSCLIWS